LSLPHGGDGGEGATAGGGGDEGAATHCLHSASAAARKNFGEILAKIRNISVIDEP
jgi:hypothetical protein